MTAAAVTVRASGRLATTKLDYYLRLWGVLLRQRPQVLASRCWRGSRAVHARAQACTLWGARVQRFREPMCAWGRAAGVCAAGARARAWRSRKKQQAVPRGHHCQCSHPSAAVRRPSAWATVGAAPSALVCTICRPLHVPLMGAPRAQARDLAHRRTPHHAAGHTMPTGRCEPAALIDLSAPMNALRRRPRRRCHVGAAAAALDQS